MAFVEDVFKGGNIATGLGVGIGMAILAPVVMPVVGAVVRPVAKTAIKMGMMAYDAAAEGVQQVSGKASETATGGTIGSLFAEARSEVDAARAERHSGADTKEKASGRESHGSRTGAATA